MKKIYDVEALDQIPIEEVILAFDGKFSKSTAPSFSQYNMHCCNGSFHNKGDKSPSLTIWKNKNICKCHVCGVGGNPISVVKQMLHVDFKAACEWLHYTFNIPYKSGNNDEYRPKVVVKKQKYEIEYERFDKSLGFTHVEVSKFIEKYNSLNKQQKLKLVYTFLYRYSLTTDRTELEKYYKGRHINSVHLEKIGYLSDTDVKTVINKMIDIFCIEDLVEFGIINDAKHKYYPLQWKQVKNCLVVPSFSIYTDLIEGMMLRPIDDSNKWFHGKESRLSVPSILKPLPFGTGYGVLSKKCDIYITEGHIDAFSLPKDTCFIATPGVQAFEVEQLGVLQGKNIKIVFDQDDAGQKVAWGYSHLKFLNQELTILDSQKDDADAIVKALKAQNIKVSQIHYEGFREKLLKAGAKSVEVITWNSELGKDVNDLLKNGNLSKVFQKN